MYFRRQITTPSNCERCHQASRTGEEQYGGNHDEGRFVGSGTIIQSTEHRIHQTTWWRIILMRKGGRKIELYEGNGCMTRRGWVE